MFYLFVMLIFYLEYSLICYFILRSNVYSYVNVLTIYVQIKKKYQALK